jgi:hypothetical protein
MAVDTKLYAEVMTVCARRLSARRNVQWAALAQRIMTACDKMDGAKVEDIADEVMKPDVGSSE